jgi:hypothetical protein
LFLFNIHSYYINSYLVQAYGINPLIIMMPLIALSTTWFPKIPNRMVFIKTITLFNHLLIRIRLIPIQISFICNSKKAILNINKDNKWIIIKVEWVKEVWEILRLTWTNTHINNLHQCLTQIIITPSNKTPLQINNSNKTITTAFPTMITNLLKDIMVITINLLLQFHLR